MLNSITYFLPEELDGYVRAELENWDKDGKTERVWKRDADVWTGEDEAKWLGWLDIGDRELTSVEKYEAFAEDVKSSGFTDVVLMGMGGSSLCPEVLSLTFGAKNFHVLDSTVPAQIISLEKTLDLAKTLFVVSSKSGSTLEPNCFKQYFFEKLSDAVGRENAGKQFIAVTDPGSRMQQTAETDGFRKIFFGDPEVGGRFSALSAFGMAPAAAMGLDVRLLLTRAGEMSEACRTTDAGQNPGVVLGTVLGACHELRRDKLTIITAPEIYDLGAWLEQLIAESTGKNDKAIIPVDRETLQPADSYGSDRIFVIISLKGSATAEDKYQEVEQLQRLGHPVIEIELESIYHLGQEFFRWEFATAVAGSAMTIDPFNQPDVEAAKVEARKLTDEFERTGSLPDEMPFFEKDGIKLFSSEEYAAELKSAAAEQTLENYLEAHFLQIEDGDYFALLAYIEMSSENEEQLQKLREQVLQNHGVATCLGFGPRFLHSTGQAYKGGANNGVFLQLTSDDAADLPVPGQKYTFGTVKSAQARGDFQVLLDRDRRALRVHLTSDVAAGLKKLVSLTDHSGDVGI